MRWFKHLAKSRNDALIRDAIVMFGLAGEHVFWRTLELMADEFNPKTPGFNRFLMGSFSKNYSISIRKTIKVLKFFKQKKVIFFAIKGQGVNQEILVNCPKLRRLTDEWTTRATKKLVSYSGVTRESLRHKILEEDIRSINNKEKETTKEKERSPHLALAIPPNGGQARPLKDKPLRLYSDAFELFWKAYPRKTGKGEAWVKWKKWKCDGLTKQIIESVEKYQTSEQWRRDNGQYIPHPATFLNQRRWEDEVESKAVEQAMSSLCPICKTKRWTKNGLCDRCHMEKHGF